MAVELNYREEGAGKPVVLLHPVGLDLSCWDQVAGILATTHRVIAVDLRGHGESPRTPRSTDIADYAGDVAALIETLDLAPCTVVGVSFGGMTALALAIARPDLLRSVVISACPNTIPDAARADIAARGDRALEGGMAAIIDETMARWFSPQFMDDPIVGQVRDRLLADRPEDWSTGWKTIANLNLGGALSGVAMPTYCIHAENDKGASLEALRSTAEGVQNGRLDVIEGAPHMVHLERAADFAARVAAHLDETGG
jgi:3-oxoadipate enol-lactonase